MVKRKGLPEWGELVLCTVDRVTQFAAWCNLEEYPEAEGMIHISEVAGKWVYDIREFVKQGKQCIAKVVKIDNQKNTVNLSLKRVSKREEKEKMNVYRREQRAEKILEQIGKELGKNLQQTYEEIGFLLQEKFGELFVAFEEIRRSPEKLEKVGLSDVWAKALVKVLEKSFKEKETRLKAELELKSFERNGVEKIKEALEGLEKNTGANVKYISAPRYMIELKTKDPKIGEKKLKEGLESVIKQNGLEGNYKFVK